MKTEAASTAKDLESELTEVRHKISLANSELLNTEINLGHMREILGSQFDALFVEAERLKDQQRDLYLIEQTRRIQKLLLALGNELPDQLALLDQANPADEISCVRLWPMLMDVIRDQVSMDVADTGGWIKMSSRNMMWRLSDGALLDIEKRLHLLWPLFKEDKALLLTLGLDPYRSRNIEALPGLRSKPEISRQTNRRNWNAIAGNGPKNCCSFPPVGY